VQVKILDILACPLDGHAPLDIIPLLQVEEDIIDGVLLCGDCGRWFPIQGGIPHLVRDGLRRKELDLALLAEYRAQLPATVTECGFPVNLNGLFPAPSPEEKRILDEGNYWSEYAKVHYAVGDTSFLDVRSYSTHPSFYNLGVLERDDKDRGRLYGMWPDHLSKVIFGFLKSRPPGLALDIGCGAGQFGLEAAYLGWDVVAIDIAAGALEVGRDYASHIGRDVFKRMHYIYAEPERPPLRQKSIDLLLSKDALHHIARIENVLKSMHAVLKDPPQAGRILFFEHVAFSPIALKIKRLANSYLHPKIQRRYPCVPVPDVLKHGAPCEDVGRDLILPLAEKYFHIRRRVKELMLYHELEFPIYYAFGKRRRFTRAVTWFIRFFIEKPLMLFQPAEFAIIIGEKEESASGRIGESERTSI
jgi:SAM-dependent methyltransferase/uncharacterized protein YbaR (Trm112 family)